jgi:hypothetical protein
MPRNSRGYRGQVFGTDYDVLDRPGPGLGVWKDPGTREGEGEVEFETMGRMPMLNR